jgi:hypothetical protein
MFRLPDLSQSLFPAIAAHPELWGGQYIHVVVLRHSDSIVLISGAAKGQSNNPITMENNNGE